MKRTITDDLEAMLEALPPRVSEPLRHREDRSELLEVVLDLGRVPEARFHGSDVVISEHEVTEADLDYLISRISPFGDDNRAGIERTLHRISAIRNRKGRIVGLTCRVGRAVYGTIRIIEDLVQSGQSLLLLGRPGVGKTTMLREAARVLADDFKKRVIIVDTSNEIGGDGDIPHPAIGHSRRMQVPTPNQQHAVMIEAVENHMPEVIVIDEIGTELEAAAARTIAERGVQLVATAHGNALENLMMNPTLADLVGGIQSVTLGDEEARRRGTQKSILERKAPPTFGVVIEIQNWDRVAVHPDVAAAVDEILRDNPSPLEERWFDENDELQRETPSPAATHNHMSVTLGHRAEYRDRAEHRPDHRTEHRTDRRLAAPAAAKAPETDKDIRIFPYGISKSRLEDAIRGLQLRVALVDDLKDANILMTSKNHYRRRPQTLRVAESTGVPIYVLRSNTISQMEQYLQQIAGGDGRADHVGDALKEAEGAASDVLTNSLPVELTPQNAYIRRLQHQLAEQHRLSSRSVGREPQRRVTYYK